MSDNQPGVLAQAKEREGANAGAESIREYKKGMREVAVELLGAELGWLTKAARAHIGL